MKLCLSSNVKYAVSRSLVLNSGSLGSVLFRQITYPRPLHCELWSRLGRRWLASSPAVHHQCRGRTDVFENKLMDLRAIRTCIITQSRSGWCCAETWCGCSLSFSLSLSREAEERAPSPAFVDHWTEVPGGQKRVLCCRLEGIKSLLWELFAGYLLTVLERSWKFSCRGELTSAAAAKFKVKWPRQHGWGEKKCFN